MPAQLRAIEDDFEELAKTLAALIDQYDEDPTTASTLESLRAAHDKAKRGAELVRQLREGKSRVCFPPKADISSYHEPTLRIGLVSAMGRKLSCAGVSAHRFDLAAHQNRTAILSNPRLSWTAPVATRAVSP